MSRADVERFVADLNSDEGLRTELSAQASGIGSVVAFARDKGYDISAEEAGAYVSAQAGRDLSDDELDVVAGGKGHLNAAAITATAAGVVTSTTATEVATGVEIAVAANTHNVLAAHTSILVVIN